MYSDKIPLCHLFKLYTTYSIELCILYCLKNYWSLSKGTFLVDYLMALPLIVDSTRPNVDRLANGGCISSSQLLVIVIVRILLTIFSEREVSVTPIISQYWEDNGY